MQYFDVRRLCRSLSSLLKIRVQAKGQGQRPPSMAEVKLIQASERGIKA